ncbi:MAG: DUF1800 family protein [Planctomycetota bacterium]
MNTALFTGGAIAALAFAPTSICIAQPALTGLVAGPGPSGVPVAIDGPVTTEPRSVAGTYVLRFEFSEPLLAVRRVEIEGAASAVVQLNPGDAFFDVELGGVQDAGVLAVDAVDVVSASGLLESASARLLVFETDYDPNGVINITDLFAYIDRFTATDPIADSDGNGVVNITDLFGYITAFGNASGLLGNFAPEVSGPEQLFAEPNGGVSLAAPVDVRDDRSLPGDLVVSVSSSDPLVVDPTDVEVVENAGDFSVRFTGSAAGASTITLEFGDGDQVSSIDLAARVSPDEAPLAQINADQYIGVAPLEVEFDVLGSSDPHENIASIDWDFGGQGIGSGEETSFTFNAAGSYDVVATLTDANGNSSQITQTVTVAASPFDLSSPVTTQEAKRFLWQAAFGPDPDDIAFITANGYEAWIDQQFSVAANLPTVAVMNQLGPIQNEGIRVDNLWDDYAISGDDQLRQRFAWALVQIIPQDDDASDSAEGLTYTYSNYLRHSLGDIATSASGNYRELLEEITYSGAMGRYLTYMFNRKADPSRGIDPDENYAREIMQLFSIGLWFLNQDGSRQVDVFGDDIPTYDNEDIKQFARIFTGLERGDGIPETPGDSRNAGPMVWDLRDHEFGAKQLLNYAGAVPPNGFIPEADASEANAISDITAALDNVFLHPSHPAFIAERLIKRFTSSNPTPQYVERVADAYAGFGPYGTGVRGDLRATIKAVLLDDEARNPVYRANPFYGKPMEPLVMILGAARATNQLKRRDLAFPYQSDRDMSFLFDDVEQAFFEAPTVFNFYLPDFMPAGTQLESNGFTAPELQILNDITSIGVVDQIKFQIADEDDEWSPAFRAELAALANADDFGGLVDGVAQQYYHTPMSSQTRSVIVNALSQINGERDRIRSAVYMCLCSPEFRVLR